MLLKKPPPARVREPLSGGGLRFAARGAGLRLEVGVAHGARMQLHVADVADAGQVHHHALKAQAEAGVRQEP